MIKGWTEKVINNFDVVKRQLSELSEVINKFKSEAVQLRIVEIVLGASSSEIDEHDEDSGTAAQSPQAKPKRRKKTRSPSQAKGKAEPSGTATRNRSSNPGASSVLTDLIDGGFFAKPKTVGNILSHCEEKLARKFQPNAFTMALMRATRAGKLSRSKNSDGQYEYTKA